MSEKIKNLLDKINYPNSMYEDFNNTSINKIIVIDSKQQWDIYIKNNTNFKYNELKTFLDKLGEYTNNKYKYNIEVEAVSENLNLYEDYFKNILILINNNNLFFDMFKDRLINEDNNYYIEVYNKAEEITLNKKF